MFIGVCVMRVISYADTEILNPGLDRCHSNLVRHLEDPRPSAYLIENMYDVTRSVFAFKIYKRV